MQLERKLQKFRFSSYGSDWFEDWYAAKEVKNLHVPAVIAYLNDLEFFGPDLAALMTSGVVRCLFTIRPRTDSDERYRRVCVTVKSVVKLLHGRDEAYKITIPPHGKTSNLASAWNRTS